MPAATILHLSDLHFGSEGQTVVWDSLRTYVNNRLKPNLIVVTGDIVDSPSEEAFKTACEAISMMQAQHQLKYLVCPGNHDRHWRGNATGWMTRWVSKFKKARDAKPWFAHTFNGHLAGLEQYNDIELVADSYKWKVRFGGLDSALNAKYLARGFVLPNDLELLNNLSNNASDVDAVFLLMHHHLLPIGAVEKVAQSAADMISGTTVVNAGMTLGALVNCQVNVVLHGHEHERNLARYGTFGRTSGETVVLGCGSSTGAVTLKPCDINRASSNLIELREDQSIWVKEVRFDGGSWGVREEGQVCIAPTTEMRKSKFYRVTGGSNAPPSSEVVKHVRITPQRNVVFRETRTDWLVNGPEFGIVSRNLSGIPVNPRIQLELPANVKAEAVSGLGFKPTGEDGAYVYKVALNGAKDRTLIPRVEISYEWIGGALLTRRDLSLVAQARQGVFRDEGFEFVAISVVNELRSFELHAHLPDGFWPEPKTVKVCVKNLHLNETPREVPYLKEYLSTAGPGVLSLKVPYPWAGYRYFMAWKLPEGRPDTPVAIKLREALRATPTPLLQAFLEPLTRHPWADLVSAVLYIPDDDKDGTPVAKRLAHVIGAGAVQQLPPEAVAIGGTQSIYRHALWDGEGIEYSQAVGDQADVAALEAGMLAGERWVFSLPVRDIAAKPGAYPMALLRVGVSEQIDKLGFGLPGAENQLSCAWVEGLVSLLNSASRRS